LTDPQQREPASQAELDAALENARAADAQTSQQTAASQLVEPILPDSYTRKIRRCTRAALLGLSLGVGLKKPGLGSALADAVDEPAQELADQLAPLLAGRFPALFGFAALAAAWFENPLREQVAELHRKAEAKKNAPRPSNVHELQIQTNEETA
jgi:hypothetical protein